MLVKFGVWKSGRTLVPLAILALMVSTPGVALGQEPSSKPPAKVQKEKPASDKTKLSDATRISTEEIARKAARQKAKDENATPAESKKDAAAADQEEAASSQVVELQPSAKVKDEKSVDGDDSAKIVKGKRTRIHGSVSGATGSGARASDAEIGAASKSGKTHVYVETGRTVTPQPH